MEKDFTGWHRLKTELQEHPTPLFQERDVWWCSIGVNIGDEGDGKNTHFSRPVLILRKFNARIFLGIPLTTKIKPNPYYHTIHFKGRDQCAMLSQIRLWSAKRLRNRMGQLPAEQFNGIRTALKEML
jgi:mRNA interferase MazF